MSTIELKNIEEILKKNSEKIRIKSSRLTLEQEYNRLIESKVIDPYLSLTEYTHNILKGI